MGVIFGHVVYTPCPNINKHFWTLNWSKHAFIFDGLDDVTCLKWFEVFKQGTLEYNYLFLDILTYILTPQI